MPNFGYSEQSKFFTMRMSSSYVLHENTNNVGGYRLFITSEQCRLARGWLGWDQKKLADVAGVARNTISLFENGRGEQRKATLMAVKHAFEVSGICFDGDTIILKPKNSPKTQIRFAEEGINVI